jgi:glycosyltransferase involved in cell wall biosynthesis
MEGRDKYRCDEPSVSIIIPAYNMEEYIRDAIESVIESKLDDVELIIVDDGSRDSTSSVVEEYTDSFSGSYDPRVRYEWQKNQGKSAAVNRGLEISRGEYVTMLDADDQLPSGGLKARYQARFDASGDPSDVIVGGFEVFDYSGTQGTRSSPEVGDPQWLHDHFYLSWKTPFHLNACLLSFDLINRVGGLDESLHRCIDGDYVLRLLRAAETVQVVDSVVYRYRKHRSSPLKRIKYRLKTARYRPRVIWKNYEGWRRWLGVPFGIAMDGGKLVYELFGKYKT